MSHRAFDGYTAPQTANGVDGYGTTIRAQSATGTAAKGGDLILASGKGTSTDGYVIFQAGNTEVLRITKSGFANVTIDGYLHTTGNASLDGYLHVGGNTTLDGYLYTLGNATLDGYLHTLGNTTLDGYLHTLGYNLFDGYVKVNNYVSIDGYIKVDGYTTIDGYELSFDGYAFAPFIRHLPMPTPGKDGYNLTIKAQNSTINPAHGGNLVLQSGDGYNGDGYFRDGYIQLLSGSIEQARIVPNKFYMLTGQRINVSNVGTTPFTIPDGYFVVMVNTSVSAMSINLPSNPILGDLYQIKDSTGSASTNNITISGNSHNIDGSPNYTINANYASVLLVYGGTQWGVL